MNRTIPLILTLSLAAWALPVSAEEAAAPAMPAEQAAPTEAGMPVKEAPAEAKPAAAGEVARAVFTTAIKDREPVDEVEQLPWTASQVYFYTDLRGMEGQHVVHRWEHNGEVMAEVGFDVKGARWRVWSSKAMMPGWTGKWTVSVVNGNGDVVATREFTLNAQ